MFDVYSNNKILLLHDLDVIMFNTHLINVGSNSVVVSLLLMFVCEIVNDKALMKVECPLK